MRPVLAHLPKFPVGKGSLLQKLQKVQERLMNKLPKL